MIDTKKFISLLENSNKDMKNSEEFWDMRAAEFNKPSIEIKEKNEFKDILNFLEIGEKNSKVNEVLDIGCGTGFFSIKFSEIASHVTSIDVSKNMLLYAKENSIKNHRGNIDFIKSDWKNIDLNKTRWNKKFDVVFASMSPAIRSYDDVKKMIDASKNLCFLSGFIIRKDNIRDGISKLIFDHEEKKHGMKIYSIFNILWGLGYYPKIIYRDSSWVEEKDVKQSIKYYVDYFSMKKDLSDEDKKSIIDFIHENSNNDILTQKFHFKTAWLCWKTGEETNE